MTIPERVKDILEEIANNTDCTCPSSPEDTRGMPCPVCLATEALKIIAEGENFSPEIQIQKIRAILDGRSFSSYDFDKS